MVQSTIAGTNPGNIVVPLSAIIDQLQGKLSSSDIDKLLYAIIAKKKNEVRPGDLITAELMNQLLRDIEDLNVRMAKLEAGVISGSAPVIDSVNPNPLRVGDTLTINGRNFEVPADSNIVTVGGSVINVFDVNSTATKLMFGVPFISISGARLETQATVRNRFGIDSESLTLLPELKVPKGFVAVVQDDANKNLPVLNPGDEVDIGFFIDSQTDIAESYAITFDYIDIIPPGTQQDWKTNTSLRSTTGPLPSPLLLNPFSPTKIIARVRVPGGTTAHTSKAKLTVGINSVNNPTGLNRKSDPLAIVAGEKLPFNDPRVEWVNEVPAQPTTTNKARRVQDAATGKEFVEIPFNNGTGLLELRATVKQGGTFTYTAVLDPNATGVWNPIAPSPSTSTRLAGENDLIGIILKLLAAANPAHTEARTLTVKAVRTPPPGAPPSDTDTFTSWTTINIRGYTP